MANIDPAPSWANIRRLETTDRNMAGPGGILNDPTTSIAARLNLLRDNDTTLGNSIAEVNSRQDAADVAISTIQGQVLNAPGTLSDLENGAALDPAAAFPDVPSVENSLGPVEAINLPIESLTARTKNLDARIRSRIDLASPKYAVDFTGVLDSTAGWLSFLDDIISTGALGVSSKGGTVSVNSTYNRVLASTDVLALDFPNITFKLANNNGLLSLRNSGVVTVAASIADVAYNLGDGAVNSLVVQIVAPGHTFAVGDVGKVFSDDVCPFNETPNQRVGEFFVVGAVDGDTIYTTARFFETYSSNAKVVKPSTATVALGALQVTSIITSTWNASAVSLSGFLFPSGSLNFRSLNAAGLNVTGCYIPQFEICGSNLKNAPSESAFGYMVNDSSSFGGKYEIRASHARHAFTTTTGNTTAGDDNWFNRGRSIGFTVRGTAQGCAAAFDTHAPALNGLFDVLVIGDYRGADTGGASVNIRSQNCRISLRSYKAKIGVSIIGTYATETQRAAITMDYEGPANCTPVLLSNESGTQAMQVSWTGSIVTANQAVFDIRNAELECLNPNITANFSAANGSLFLLAAGASVRSHGGVFRIAGAASSGHVVSRHSATNTSAHVADLRIPGNAGKLSTFGAAGAFDPVMRYENVEVETTLSAAAFTADATPTKASATYRNANFTRPLQYRTSAFTVAGNQAINLQFSGHPTITHRVETTVDGVNINSLTKGAFPGQLMTIANRSSSAFPITLINNSAGNISLSASVVIQPGAGTTLYYDGTNWQRAA